MSEADFPHDACAYCGLPVAVPRPTGEDEALYCCYGCRLVSRIVGTRNRAGPRAWNLLRLSVGAFLAMNVMMISILLYTGSVEEQAVPVFHWVLLGLSTPAMAILVYPFVAGAAGEIARGRLSLDTLIAVGSLAAFFTSAASTLRGAGHVYFDTATMLPLLVTFGKVLEASAKGRAADLMHEMESLLPPQAERIGEGGPQSVPAAELRKGDRLLVRPGAAFPADGVVVEGRSTVLEATFTGEPGSRPRGPGDAVLAGTVNQEGALVVEARAVGAELLLARIVEMVAEARRRAAPIERAAQRAAAIFAPATLALAAGAGAAWLAFGSAAEAGLAALAVVVVACPCALGIATPLAVALAIGRAAREGVLVRGGEIMERAGHVRTVFFDKTGTLTLGSPELTAVECLDPAASEEELLGWLAGLESQSEHALARAGVEAARRKRIDIGTVSDLTAVAGRGVRGIVTRGGISREVFAGSEEFVNDSLSSAPDEAPDALPCATSGPAPKSRPIAMGRLWKSQRSPDESFDSSGDGGTYVYVAWEGQVRGRAVFADVVRPEAAEAVADLRRMGIDSVLLSGDRAESAGAIARQVGISRVEAPCLPQEKLDRIRAAAASKAGGAVAMVGDGINDAPSLAAADVGIAIGAGTDLARRSGGVVLLADRLVEVPWLIALGRQTRHVVRQNLAWAFGYNAVALAAAAAGVLHPLLAAVAMVVSSLTVLSNSLRLRSFPPATPAARRIGA